MHHIGELISLGVAVSWTITAWFAAKASLRVGAMVTNVLRLVLAMLLLGVALWITVGRPYPVYADRDTWLWLGLSALVGYVFGDYCLFNSYVYIGPRFGQLMMTLAPPAAAIPADAPALMEGMLPFASTMLRAIVGGIGFLVILGLQKGFGKLKSAVKDPVALTYASIVTLFGPAVGVSLSLMAVIYANAGVAMFFLL